MADLSLERFIGCIFNSFRSLLLNRTAKFLVLVTFALILPIFILKFHTVSRGDAHEHYDKATGVQLKWMNTWVFQFLLNLCGYASVIIPGYLIIQHVQQMNFLRLENGSCFSRILIACVLGSPVDGRSGHAEKASSESKQLTLLEQFTLLSYCSSGLLVSYLVWGLLQERIMAIEYIDATLISGNWSVGGTHALNGFNLSVIAGKLEFSEGLEWLNATATNAESMSREHFKNSLFLEFMNRILAVVIAVTILVSTKQPRHYAPIYKYSYNAFSNVMSSWCQYEALKYVSFPVQVLAKASKVIPVMLMGRIVSRRTFTVLEYVTAGMISLGLFMFLISSDDGFKAKRHRDVGDGGVAGGSLGFVTLSGVALMCGYLLFDAFTTNWQGELFRTYHMTHIQMMAGSNLFSVLYTSVSLLEQGGFTEAIDFMTRHPLFLLHIIALAIASSIGQLFIYFTIDRFGAVTFTIIMTVRQAFAILLSCVIYRHPVHFIGVVGIIICFAAIFLRTYRSHSLAVLNRAGKAKAGDGMTSADVVRPSTTTDHV